MPRPSRTARRTSAAQTPADNPYFAWPEVAYVPLVDAAPSTLALARRRDSDNPLVAESTELAVEIAAHAAECNTPYSSAGGG